MNFSGWQRVSLVDYPKTISTVVFTSKCNFDCAYCHNPSLKTAQPATHSEAAILEYLARRHKQIDALVISGGEPSLRAEEIIGFCHRLKTALPNLLIKVDTKRYAFVYVLKNRVRTEGTENTEKRREKAQSSRLPVGLYLRKSYTP